MPAAVSDSIYRLALRMLWHPQDAEDAAQEALIKIMTRIGSYRGEATFATWAHNVAANHILSFRKSRVEQENLTVRRYGEDLAGGLVAPGTTRPDAGLLAAEVKLGCTLGTLQCLDRDHRLAYILTDVFDLSSADAAFICGITPGTLRKRATAPAAGCASADRAGLARSPPLRPASGPGRRRRRDGTPARPGVADAQPPGPASPRIH